MKNVLMIFALIISTSLQKRVNVCERLAGIKIEGPGYVHMPTDKTFKCHNESYLIRTLEEFDDSGDLASVSFWKSDGYLDFKKAEFSKFGHFLEDHDLVERLDVQLLDGKEIKIGNEIVPYLSINNKLQSVYYQDTTDKKIVYVIKFK